MERDNMSDLLNTFKNVLNTSSATPSQSDKTSNTNSNMNITPEMIAQFANNIKNQSSKINSADNVDTNITTNMNSNSNNNSSNNNSENNSYLDFDTILKIKNIMEAFNQTDDNRSKLLYSLKPYLRESRQKKLDQYVNLFKISGIAKILKQEKGDSK